MNFHRKPRMRRNTRGTIKKLKEEILLKDRLISHLQDQLMNYKQDETQEKEEAMVLSNLMKDPFNF
jgi:hypothetical protein